MNTLSTCISGTHSSRRKTLPGNKEIGKEAFIKSPSKGMISAVAAAGRYSILNTCRVSHVAIVIIQNIIHKYD